MKPALPFLLALLASSFRANAQTSQPTTTPTTDTTTFTFLEPTVPAGTAVHVSADNLFTPATQLFDHCLSWNFGESTLVTDPTRYSQNADTHDIGHNFPGPDAAHIYAAPGTYPITLTDRQRNPDGSPGQILRTFTRTITITPANRKIIYVDASAGNDSNTGLDINHALKTADHAVDRLAGNTELRFHAGQEFPLTRYFNCQHVNLVIGSYGTGAPPHLLGTVKGNLFTFWNGKTHDVTITGLTIDADWIPAQTSAGLKYHQPIAVFGNLRGQNVALTDCQIANNDQGPSGEIDLHGFFMLRCNQTEPWGITSRFLWLEGYDLVVAGNTAVNSVNESPFRMADLGGTRVNFVFNRTGQLLVPTQGRSLCKAGLTFRTGTLIHVESNLCVDSEFSFDSHGYPNTVTNLDVRRNLLLGLGNNDPDTLLHIKPGVTDAAVQDNQVYRSQGPAYVISPSDSDPRLDINRLTFRNNQAVGWSENSRLLQIDNHTPISLTTFTNSGNVFEHPTTRPTTLPTTMPSN